MGRISQAVIKGDLKQRAHCSTCHSSTPLKNFNAMAEHLQVVQIALKGSLQRLMAPDFPSVTTWTDITDQLNHISHAYPQQIDESIRVMNAVAKGDMSQHMSAKDHPCTPATLVKLRQASDEMGKESWLVRCC